MPNMRDADVLLHGQIINVADRVRRETGEVYGVQATVMTDDFGFAKVNISLENARLVELGSKGNHPRVLWWVTNMPYEVGDNNGMTTRFERVATVEDLDTLADALGALASSK